MSAFEDILNEDDDVMETAEPTVETPASESGEPAAAVAESPAPEPTETPEPAPVAEEAQPITREEDGAVWSEKAKRWYLEGKIVAGEPPAAPSEPSAPSVAEAPPVVEAPKAPAYEGEAWTVRGGGQKHAIPGAIVGKDGWVHLSPEHQATHKALLAAGIEHNTNWQREKQTFQQQMREAEARGQASAAKYNTASVFLFDKLAALLADNPQELELTKRELALHLKAADLEIPRSPVTNEPEPEQIEQAFTQTLVGYLDELFEDAPKGVLSADDVKDIRDAIGARLAAYAAEVDGQVMLDTHAVKRDFDRELRIAQRAQQTAREAAAAAQKAKAAAAFNAANTPKAPAVPPRKPTPKPVPAGTAPSGKKPSWDQAVKAAWDDSDDE